MAHVSDSAISYEDMSTTDLITQMKKMMTVLDKKSKKIEASAAKLEEKKTKAAPAKGVQPAHLAQNTAWVKYVHGYIYANGWGTFIHMERHGAGMAEVEYPPSELVVHLDTDGKESVGDDGEVVMIHVFEGSGKEQPNLSHAMSLSKLYKVDKPELYEAFLAEYQPGDAPVKPAKVAKECVSMTLAERRQLKAEADAAKELEKETNRLERVAARQKKAAAAEAEKALKAKKVPKAAVVRAVVPAARPASAAAVPKAASAVPKTVAAPKTAATPATAEKPKMVFEIPEDTLVHEWTWEGVTYLVNSDHCVWEKGSDDEPGNWVGMVDLEKNIIDTTAVEPVLED